MIIYNAGAFAYKFNERIEIDVLESYYYLTATHKTHMKRLMGTCKNFFLDSGAFSAFTQDATIDIDEYLKFCVKNNITNYSVLDVTGSAKKTLINQKYMESKGAKPIPCFHYGEPWEYLHNYCKDYDYVALRGMVPISTNELKRWLDAVFTKYPKQKFHGFRLTGLSLMDRYPWHSVDSTSYLQGAKTASIYVNKRCYTFNGLVNDQSKKFKAAEDQEFEYMCRKYGFTKEMLLRTTNNDYEMHEKGYWLRCLYNIYYFIEYNLTRKDVDFKIKQDQLTDYSEVPKIESPEPANFKQWVHDNYGDIDPEIAKKLVSHEFEIPKDQVRLC